MMRHLQYFSLCFIFFIVFLPACSNHKKQNDSEAKLKSQKPLNPNGDSELALLMREMYDDAIKVKNQVKSGDDITVDMNYEHILSVTATEPEKANSPEFKAFAKSYLQSIENLKLAPIEERQEHYNSMITNCVSCHQTLCPGPLVRIKKLQ